VDVAGLEPAGPLLERPGGMRGTLRRYFIDTNMVGGRDRDRTGDPLRAKQGGENTKVALMVSLIRTINKILALQMSRSCTEILG